jgi:copper chaperone CopZ
MPTRETTLSVPDMRCEGCTERVTNVLERLKGVRSADVSLENKTATVELEDGAVTFDDLKAAVENAGYAVES